MGSWICVPDLLRPIAEGSKSVKDKDALLPLPPVCAVKADRVYVRKTYRAICHLQRFGFVQFARFINWRIIARDVTTDSAEAGSDGTPKQWHGIG
jgi:hypothetical protein